MASRLLICALTTVTFVASAPTLAQQITAPGNARHAIVPGGGPSPSDPCQGLYCDNEASRTVSPKGARRLPAPAGLATGLIVRSTKGLLLGKVSQVVTSPDGSIQLVIVTSSTGVTYRLSPSSLSLSGGVLTTTGG